MGNYAVPEHIRAMKPKGTMVKKINNKFYVYEYKSSKAENGKRITKMGKSIGMIKEGIGFVPNDNFLRDKEITSYEFGQYVITTSITSSVLDLLLGSFNPLDAYMIYFLATIHFVNGFQYLKKIDTYFNQSYLSLKYPEVSLSYHKLAQLLDDLGRRQSSVTEFEQNLICSSSSQIAIDGHVIPSGSHENNLAENGYKYNMINDSQINLLMAYDINTGKPLLSRMYEGASPDKVSIKEIFERYFLKEILFIVDRGFYSNDNINLFSSNGNKYIIPLSPNLVSYKKAVEELSFDKMFVYEKSKKRSVIEYKEIINEIGGTKIIVFRDSSQNMIEQQDYLKNMGKDSKRYTKEKFMKVKDFFGIIVLETNCMDKSAEEIFSLYKKRWKIETYFNYFKNNIDYKGLHVEDYYMAQGLSFIMLIEGLIHSEMAKAISILKGNSLDDILLEGRFLKIHKSMGKWYLDNISNSRNIIMEQLKVDYKKEVDIINKAQHCS